MRVLTWELPRGSCRMPRASQAGSGMRSITPGLTTGARRWRSVSAHSRLPALAGIYPQPVPMCLLVFPLPEAEL